MWRTLFRALTFVTSAANHVCPLRVMTIEMRQNVAAINLHFSSRGASKIFGAARVFLFVCLMTAPFIAPCALFAAPACQKLWRHARSHEQIYFMIKKSVSLCVLKFCLIRSADG